MSDGALLVTNKPRPRPSYLDRCEKLGVRGGQQVWIDRENRRLLTYDSLHGEIEAFTLRGVHIGVLDAVTGVFIKPPVKGRKLDV